MGDFEMKFLFDLGGHAVKLPENKAIVIRLSADRPDQSAVVALRQPVSTSARDDECNVAVRAHDFMCACRLQR